MQLSVSDDFYLTGVLAHDKDAYLKHFDDGGEISGCTPAIQYPYTKEAADWWVSHRIKFREEAGREISFAIRNTEGLLIGAVGADDFPVGEAHRAEVSFWLAKSYRRRGIATAALRLFIRYAFEQLCVVRLVAHTLSFNTASVRVLEKNGFWLEGCLRKHTRIKEDLFDTLVYGLLIEDWRSNTCTTNCQE
jgi:ribosomal-protein-alanine N-acetyltransferase